MAAAEDDEEPEDPAQYTAYPKIPADAENLAVNDESKGLINKDGDLIYILSEDALSWQPFIPDIMAADLPGDFQVKQDGKGLWHILTWTDTSLYIFAPHSLIWEKEVDENEDIEAEIADQINGVSECPGANPQRITGSGSVVRVVNAVIPLRRAPRVSTKNLIVGLQMGHILEIVDGLVCTPFLDRANLWWLVRTADGADGYAAEGSAISDVYYLEAVASTP